jgi:hypothetical protein
VRTSSQKEETLSVFEEKSSLKVTMSGHTWATPASIQEKTPEILEIAGAFQKTVL